MVDLPNPDCKIRLAGHPLDVPTRPPLGRRTTVVRGTKMPVTPYLKGQAFESDTVQAMGMALEKICARLKSSCNAADQVTQILASKIIELAQCRGSDPETLCRRILQDYVTGDQSVACGLLRHSVGRTSSGVDAAFHLGRHRAQSLRDGEIHALLR
jgi:hypothetical protein